MGNQGSSASGAEEGAAIIPKSTIAKLRVMTKFTHDHRLRVDERTELYSALAELRESRRRLSEDLAAEKEERTANRSMRGQGRVDICADKPSWEAYVNDKFCALCGKPARRSEGYPCRVCPRLFHRLCLSKCGECRDADLQAANESALTNAGWSCYHCANLSLLLTEEELSVLIDEFEVFDTDKDEHISWKEFLAHVDESKVMRRDDHKRTLSEERDMRLDFKLADQDNDDTLDWWEFLNHQAKIILATRPKEELVKLLTEKEIIKCRTLFKTMDTDHDEILTVLEARQAVRKWCERFEHGLDANKVSEMATHIDIHAEIRAQMLVDADNCQKESISWSDFLAAQALYIICTRPNIRASTIEAVIQEAHADD
ncbi:protein KIAA1045 homolog isoform X1 [Elysia marginata]|uniref:Protein KIAA1045 homolog isoform X1 n=1 Tax=Elysia marginata TaxID=1093978 RepID=A0AAV4I304_9GAST|nr:protein KIAA1045 homolog isoform X1 [Elysia marginata]